MSVLSEYGGFLVSEGAMERTLQMLKDNHVDVDNDQYLEVSGQMFEFVENFVEHVPAMGFELVHDYSQREQCCCTIALATFLGAHMIADITEREDEGIAFDDLLVDRTFFFVSAYHAVSTFLVWCHDEDYYLLSTGVPR